MWRAGAPLEERVAVARRPELRVVEIEPVVVSAFDEFLPPAPPRHVDWPEPLPPVLSPTAITTFLTCPEQWRRVYLLGETSRTSSALLIGRVDSKAAEMDLGQKITTGVNMALPLVKEVAAASFDEELEKVGGAGEVEWDPDKAGEDKPGPAKDLAVGCAAAYRTQRSELIVPIAVERRIEVQLPGVIPTFSGYLDVEEGPRVRERKTSGRSVSKPGSTWPTQTLLYTVATGKQTVYDVTHKQAKGGPAVLPELWGPDVETAGERLQQVAATVTESIVGLLEKLGPDNAWPGTGAVQFVSPCGWCDFSRTCRFASTR